MLHKSFSPGKTFLFTLIPQVSPFALPPPVSTTKPSLNADFFNRGSREEIRKLFDPSVNEIVGLVKSQVDMVVSERRKLPKVLQLPFQEHDKNRRRGSQSLTRLPTL
jgi:hypothetical protein